MTDYKELCDALCALVENVPHRTANLANATALLYHTLEDLNWAGFYLMEDGKLVLNAFQGKPACIEIPVGKGVCGTAVAEKKTKLVANVHEFPGHIACDSASNSEIVVPLFDSDGEVVGVLDIDSPSYSRFDESDRSGLEEFARIIEKVV
ncbi:MAG: GAF domain-containing protein [Clostridia bacterium]|nr:GAF domain-containing protein [Clostridia bacterium]